MRVIDEDLAWMIGRVKDSKILDVKDSLDLALDLRDLREKARAVVDSPEHGDGFGGYSVSEENMKALRAEVEGTCR
jgi:hypothetical protein